MNRKSLVLFRCFTAFVVAVLCLSFSSNPPNGNTGAPGDGTCANCHAGNNFEGNVMINGLPGEVVSGETYSIGVTVRNTDGMAIRAGFQMVSLFNGEFVKAGDFTVNTDDVGISEAGGREYIEHRGAKNFQDSISEWIFDWEAPLVDEGKEIIMFTAANIANGSGSSGDAIRFAQKEIMVQPAVSSVLDVSILTDGIPCNGGTADLEAIVTGGTEEYTYIWSDGTTTKINEGVAAGMYSVTVTDLLDSVATSEITVIEPQLLEISVQTTDEAGVEAMNGSASATVSGGTAPFTYQWSNDSTSSSTTGLTEGSYEVTVTDANNCSIATGFVIGRTCAFTINLEVAQVTCIGASDGEATIDPANFVQPLTFEWSNGESAFIAVAALAPGEYAVTVSDGSGCTIVEEFVIADPDPIATDFAAHFPNCEDFTSNSLTAMPSGGSGEYTYLWGSGETTAEIADLLEDTYYVTITDSNGCSIADSTELVFGDNEPPVITYIDSIAVYVDSTGTLDFGANLVTVTDNCGIMSVEVLGDATCAVDGPNIWQYEATDNSGNVSTVSIYVPEIIDTFPPVVTCVADIVQQGCDTVFYAMPAAMDNCNIASVEMSEGLPSGSIFPKDSTKVTFNYYDNSGNFACCSFWVIITNDLTLSIDEVNDATSANGGSISITAGGGSGNFSYEWIMDDTIVVSNFEDVTNLMPGSYTVFVSDDTGCLLRSESILIELGSSVLHQSSSILKAYPNPTEDRLTIEYNDAVSRISVYSINGQFLSVEKKQVSDKQSILQVGDLNPGMYFVKLNFKDRSETLKFMKK